MAAALNPLEQKALAAVPMFSAHDAQSLAAIVAECRRFALEPAQVLFRPGEPAFALFVVLAGRVKLYQLSPRGDEQVLHHFGPGQSFAEAAVFRGGAFPAFAEALVPTVLLEVRRDVLLSLIRKEPQVALGLLAGLSQKLHEFARLIEQLSLKEVPARLADVILQYSAEAGSPQFTLHQSKRQLAAQIGTVAETLSRAQKKLSQQGLIAVDGKTVTVLDAEGLRQLANDG